MTSGSPLSQRTRVAKVHKPACAKVIILEGGFETRVGSAAETEDIIKEVKRHSFYLKSGAKRRVKQALLRKRARKKIRKESDGIRN